MEGKAMSLAIYINNAVGFHSALIYLIRLYFLGTIFFPQLLSLVLAIASFSLPFLYRVTVNRFFYFASKGPKLHASATIRRC